MMPKGRTSVKKYGEDLLGIFGKASENITVNVNDPDEDAKHRKKDDDQLHLEVHEKVFNNKIEHTILLLDVLFSPSSDQNNASFECIRVAACAVSDQRGGKRKMRDEKNLLLTDYKSLSQLCEQFSNTKKNVQDELMNKFLHLLNSKKDKLIKMSEEMKLLESENAALKRQLEERQHPHTNAVATTTTKSNVNIKATKRKRFLKLSSSEENTTTPESDSEDYVSTKRAKMGGNGSTKTIGLSPMVHVNTVTERENDTPYQEGEVKYGRKRRTRKTTTTKTATRTTSTKAIVSEVTQDDAPIKKTIPTLRKTRSQTKPIPMVEQNCDTFSSLE